MIVVDDGLVVAVLGGVGARELRSIGLRIPDSPTQPEVPVRRGRQLEGENRLSQESSVGGRDGLLDQAELQRHTGVDLFELTAVVGQGTAPLGQWSVRDLTWRSAAVPGGLR
jgi:hypothetical protein